MLKTVRSEIGDLGWLVRIATLAAIAGAIYREMRLPAEERTWHGRLLGFIPYDFRPPTPRRVVEAYWNPKSERLFHDQPFGVGWALNFAAAAGLLRGMRQQTQPAKPTARRTPAKREPA